MAEDTLAKLFWSRVERSAAIAWRDVDTLHLRRPGQPPGQRMLAAATADDEDFQGINTCNGRLSRRRSPPG